MCKKTIMIASIWFLMGILVPVSVAVGEMTDNFIDIYGNSISPTEILSTDTPAEIYQASDKVTKVQVIDEPFGIYEDWRGPYIRSDRWLVKTDRAHEARREVVMKWTCSKMPKLCLL